jgi:hypothetical protein
MAAKKRSHLCIPVAGVFVGLACASGAYDTGQYQAANRAAQAFCKALYANPPTAGADGSRLFQLAARQLTQDFPQSSPVFWGNYAVVASMTQPLHFFLFGNYDPISGQRLPPSEPLLHPDWGSLKESLADLGESVTQVGGRFLPATGASFNPDTGDFRVSLLCLTGEIRGFRVAADIIRVADAVQIAADRTRGVPGRFSASVSSPGIR